MFSNTVLRRPFTCLKNLVSSVRFQSNKALNLSEAGVQYYLKNVLLEYERLLQSSRKSFDEIRRLTEIRPVALVLEQRINLYDSIESLKEMTKNDNDPEVKKMIKEEAEIYLARIKEIDNDLQSVLLEPVLTDGGVLLEVVAGAGGQEAMLFAKELFDLYRTYCSYKNWDFDIASHEAAELGGVRKASALVRGHGVPEMMKIEAGVHRVQRVPATEKSGRLHTSTVSVAVLPQPSEIEVNIPQRDLLIETKRASGAGGQHVNKTESAVRIVHTPTNIAVECQEARSQIKNREIAMQKLRTLLLQKQIEEQSLKINTERKSQMGNSNRNEKIRTYNFQQDRVTEHREEGGSNYNLKTFMEDGEQLELLQSNLLKQYRYESIMEEINNLMKKHKVDSSSS